MKVSEPVLKDRKSKGDGTYRMAARSKTTRPSVSKVVRRIFGRG